MSSLGWTRTWSGAVRMFRVPLCGCKINDLGFVIMTFGVSCLWFVVWGLGFWRLLFEVWCSVERIWDWKFDAVVGLWPTINKKKSTENELLRTFSLATRRIFILLTNFSLSFTFLFLVFRRPFLLPLLVSDQQLIKQKIKGKRTAPHVFPSQAKILFQFIKINSSYTI